MERFSKCHPGLLQRVRSTRNQVSTKLHRHKDSFKDRKPGWPEGPVSKGECESAAGQKDRDAEELISGAGVGGMPKTDGLFPGRK